MLSKPPTYSKYSSFTSSLNCFAAAGVCHAQTGRYERDTSRPSAEAVERLARVLETTVDYLMNGTVDAAAADAELERELVARLRQVETLPAEDRSVIKSLIDAYLTKQQLRRLVG